MNNKLNTTPIMYASCFGKATIPEGDADITLITDMVKVLARHSIGVVNGGYAGGVMGIADDTIVEEARRKGYSQPEKWSYGVPVECFEEGYGPTTSGVRVKAVNTVEERLEKFADLSDFYIVFPRGGTGTAHEFIHYLLRSSDFEKSPKPIIAYGKHWRKLLEVMIELCDTSDTMESFPWLYFVNTLEEFEQKVKEIVEGI